MSGIDDIRANLLKLKFNKTTANFFEGMACDGGCLNGALSLHHDNIKNSVEIDRYSNAATYKDIDTAVAWYEESLKENKEKRTRLLSYATVGLSNICYTFAVKIIGKVLVRRLPAEWAHRSLVVLSIVSL